MDEGRGAALMRAPRLSWTRHKLHETCRASRFHIIAVQFRRKPGGLAALGVNFFADALAQAGRCWSNLWRVRQKLGQASPKKCSSITAWPRFHSSGETLSSVSIFPSATATAREELLITATPGTAPTPAPRCPAAGRRRHRVATASRVPAWPSARKAPLSVAKTPVPSARSR